jgi:hypothetical protein
MNKVVYVKASFEPIMKEVEAFEPTGETYKGLFGGKKDVMQTVREVRKIGESDCQIDGKKLAEDIAEAVARLNEEGYEIVSVTPLLSGKYDYAFDKSGGPGAGGGWGYGYGYGYSYTEGVTIIARKVSGQAG